MSRETTARYEIRNVKGSSWAKEVLGLDLKRHLSEQETKALRKEVDDHRLLIVRDQVEISSWFGELESTFYKHPESPHPDVFRVSNDEAAGCTGVGRTGWHIDGSFQPAPFHYSTYHIESVPRRGATVFAPLTEVVAALSADVRQRWDRLWKVSDRRGAPLHPLIYKHPITGKQTMCFHTGMTAGFRWDVGSKAERAATREETHNILAQIDSHFREDIDDLIYHHHWREGDFILSDNLAVAHEASPDTQLPVEEVGLRIMHRTTIKGTHVPKK